MGNHPVYPTTSEPSPPPFSGMHEAGGLPRPDRARAVRGPLLARTSSSAFLRPVVPQCHDSDEWLKGGEAWATAHAGCEAGRGTGSTPAGVVLSLAQPPPTTPCLCPQGVSERGELLLAPRSHPPHLLGGRLPLQRVMTGRSCKWRTTSRPIGWKSSFNVIFQPRYTTPFISSQSKRVCDYLLKRILYRVHKKGRAIWHGHLRPVVRSNGPNSVLSRRLQSQARMCIYVFDSQVSVNCI
jgi:hypothetical protein